MKSPFALWAASASGFALLSTFLIAPGAAQAQSACATGSQSASYWTGLTSGCTIGDKLYTGFSFDAGYSNAGSGYSLVRDPITDRYTFSASGLSLGTGTHNYSYTVSVNGTTDMFDRFRTNVGTSDDPTPGVTKTLNLVSGITTYGPSTSTIAVGNPGASVPGNIVNLPDGITSGTFNGSIVVSNANLSKVDTFTDSLWQKPVPGPLPILGAGAAFGFSRKLRRRIKSVA